MNSQLVRTMQRTALRHPQRRRQRLERVGGRDFFERGVLHPRHVRRIAADGGGEVHPAHPPSPSLPFDDLGERLHAPIIANRNCIDNSHFVI